MNYEDHPWHHTCTLDHYPNLFDTSKVLADISQDYTLKHLAKVEDNMHIVKFQCSVHHLDILKIDYVSEGYVNKKNSKDGK
jgi:hypothetical protein